MRKIFIPIALSIMVSSCATLGSIKDTVENTAMGKVNQKAANTTSDAMDTMLGNGHRNSTAQNNPNNSNNSNNSNSNNQNNSNNGSNSSAANSNNATGSSAAPPQSIAAYQNYDFKPGDTIIFSDDFTNDQDGEFPAHWNLDAGQGVVNTVPGGPAYLFTAGDYGLISPRMTNKSYLTDPFTVEFDYLANTAEAPLIRFYDANASDHDLRFGHAVKYGYYLSFVSGNEVGTKTDYMGKWHHAAMIYKNGQIKAYLDNTRALVIPQANFVPVSLKIGGEGDPNNPVTFRNVRIASGGSANTIGIILTNGKFVTHGITFDIGKATLQPQSMGVLNDVAKFLKSNSDVSMEIDGHTDSDGSASANLALSQDRAAAVKGQLVMMGIDASRLTTKGLGATMPIASNDTPEGKANNRRVEFVKM